MNEHTVLWKSIAVGAIAPAMWFALRNVLPVWATWVTVALLAAAFFRLAPPRPASTPRRDAVITAGTIVAAVVLGLLAQRL